MHRDRATKFTIDVFNAIERRLSIQWTLDGDPIYLPSEVSHFSIQMLRSDLADLHRSSSLHDAILDMETGQRDHNIIQTTGVGLAPDFDLFSKIGLLLGDRLVLWDTLLQGIFACPDHLINKSQLGGLVCQLLLLKPVVERGGILLLPHPLLWLERSRYYFQKVADAGALGTEFYGFLNARALLDEGIALHPYSMAENREKVRLAKSTRIGDHDLMHDETQVYHDQLVDFMIDEKFNLLSSVSINAFHKFLGPREYRRELRRVLSDAIPGESQPERKIHPKQTMQQIKKSIDDHNKDTYLRRFSLEGASIGAIGASTALLHDAMTATAFFSMMTGAMATMSRWVPVVEKIFSKPTLPTLYQQFYLLEKAAEDEFLKQQADSWRALDA